MSSTSPRVLVTGGGGFIGRPCLHALRARGMDVHALSSSHPEGHADGVTWHQANLLDGTGAALVVRRVRPSHLLHLGWDMSPGAWSAGKGQLDWLRGSLDLVERFVGGGGTRVVVAGSCAEYDWKAGVCSEFSTPCAPETLYGAAKLALGTVVGALARDVNISAASARIFFLYGPGERANRLVPSIVRSLLTGNVAACTHGRQVRDFLFVDDVADALVTLLTSTLTGAVNIGSGMPLAISDLARRIGELVERPDLIRLGARPAPADEAPLVVADVSRLREELAWTPQYTLDTGLAATIAWWRAQCAQGVARD